MLGRKWKPKYLTSSKPVPSLDTARQEPKVMLAGKGPSSTVGAKKKSKAKTQVLSTKSK